MFLDFGLKTFFHFSESGILLFSELLLLLLVLLGHVLDSLCKLLLQLISLLGKFLVLTHELVQLVVIRLIGLLDELVSLFTVLGHQLLVNLLVLLVDLLRDPIDLVFVISLHDLGLGFDLLHFDVDLVQLVLLLLDLVFEVLELFLFDDLRVFGNGHSVLGCTCQISTSEIHCRTLFRPRSVTCTSFAKLEVTISITATGSLSGCTHTFDILIAASCRVLSTELWLHGSRRRVRSL